MPSSFVDVCRFLPTAGGTADWTFSTPVLGYQSPLLSGAINGAVYSLRSESADLTQWELSVGAYNSGTGVFARTTVLYNSSGTGTGPGQSGAGTKINFSTIPQVAVVALGEDLLLFNAAMSLTGAQQVQGLKNLAAYANEVVSSGTATLGTGNVGKLTLDTGSGQTFTIPAAASFLNQVFIAVHIQSGTLTITRSGSDAFFGPGGWNVTSLSLTGLGDFVVLTATGTGSWGIIGGSPSVLGGVSYSLAQTLTQAQQLQALQNVGSFASGVVSSGTATLGAGQVGRVVIPTGASQTFTLPSAASFAGLTFTPWANTSPLTVTCSGTDTIIGPGPTVGGVASLTMSNTRDFVVLMGHSAGVWLVVSASVPVLQGLATKAEQQTGTASTLVTPARQQDHDSACKSWVNFTGTTPPVIQASYNVSGVVRNGVGDWTVSFTTAFASANYVATFMARTGGVGYIAQSSAQVAGSYRFVTFNAAGTQQDTPVCMLAFFGRQ